MQALVTDYYKCHTKMWLSFFLAACCFPLKRICCPQRSSRNLSTADTIHTLSQNTQPLLSLVKELCIYRASTHTRHEVHHTL